MNEAGFYVFPSIVIHFLLALDVEGNVMRSVSSFISVVPTTCRYCGSTNVRLSKSVSFGTHHDVYRCNRCHQHFKVSRFSLRNFLPIAISTVFAVLILLSVASIYVSTTRMGDLKQDNITKASTQSGANL